MELESGVLGKDESREEFDGPVVCVSASAGFKDRGAGRGPREAPVLEWGGGADASAGVGAPGVSTGLSRAAPVPSRRRR